MPYLFNFLIALLLIIAPKQPPQHAVQDTLTNTLTSRVPTAYLIDQARSEVSFTVSHLRFAKVRGVFGRFNGSLNFDTANPSSLQANARIDVQSLETGNLFRDDALLKKKYFEANLYPYITFTSKEVQSTTDGKIAITGDLKIRDVVKTITFEATHTNLPNNRVRFEATTRLNRHEFGVSGGKFIVGSMLDVYLKIEAVKRPS
jgi:polyisoprenoid-binding protein YceI